MRKNVSEKFSHISQAVVWLDAAAAFMSPVLHGEWLNSKPWDSVSAGKNVSTFIVEERMSNFWNPANTESKTQS